MILPTLPLLSPGAALQAFLQTQKVKQSELADRLGRSSQYVTDIIKGKKVFDLELALELESALPNFRAEQWTQLALEYLREQKQQSGVLTRAAVLDRHPQSADLLRLGWVENDKDPAALDQQLIEFWSHRDIACHFKNSAALSTDQSALEAWSIQVYRLAQRQRVTAYDEGRMAELVSRLQDWLEVPGYVSKVADLVRSYGIAMVFLPHLQRCPVDGVASFNHGRPYIGLSLRHGKLDQFWFTLFHELAHIEKKHDRISLDVNLLTSSSLEIQEQEANEVAREHLISTDRYQEFLKLNKTDLASINRFAFRFHVHPSILLGRLKFEEKLDWNQHAREHVSVREYLL